MLPHLRRKKRFQSTPLPTGRSDRQPVSEWVRRRGFNPRPSQPEGATGGRCNGAGQHDCFNPRPSQPEGATQLLVERHQRALVSIHAPPNRKERLTGKQYAQSEKMFQSTPLPTGRSDRSTTELPTLDVWFQSTPLPTGRSDLKVAPDGLIVGWFQSTPLPTGRSDLGSSSLPISSRCFNPRPSQPEGATALGV